ncbi:hypothetical protein RIF29_14561 [Crotalaria pallida]|uniref:Uncharacterized protein n=1 Tax=Crotalaria pallida TaxID=3830 RepID=A0AAN9FBX1_CROPI
MMMLKSRQMLQEKFIIRMRTVKHRDYVYCIDMSGNLAQEVLSLSFAFLFSDFSSGTSIDVKCNHQMWMSWLLLSWRQASLEHIAITTGAFEFVSPAEVLTSKNDKPSQ